MAYQTARLSQDTVARVVRSQERIDRANEAFGVLDEAISEQRTTLIDRTNAAAEASVRLFDVLLAGAAVVLGVGIVTASLLSRGVNRTLRRLVHANELVMQGELDYRISAAKHDDLGRTAVAFNRMADELQLQARRRDALLRVFRRFAADDCPEQVMTYLLDLTQAEGAAVFRMQQDPAGLVRSGARSPADVHRSRTITAHAFSCATYGRRGRGRVCRRPADALRGRPPLIGNFRRLHSQSASVQDLPVAFSAGVAELCVRRLARSAAQPDYRCSSRARMRRRTRISPSVR